MTRSQTPQLYWLLSIEWRTHIDLSCRLHAEKYPKNLVSLNREGQSKWLACNYTSPSRHKPRHLHFYPFTLFLKLQQCVCTSVQIQRHLPCSARQVNDLELQAFWQNYKTRLTLARIHNENCSQLLQLASPTPVCTPCWVPPQKIATTNHEKIRSDEAAANGSWQSTCKCAGGKIDKGRVDVTDVEVCASTLQSLFIQKTLNWRVDVEDAIFLPVVHIPSFCEAGYMAVRVSCCAATERPPHNAVAIWV